MMCNVSLPCIACTMMFAPCFVSFVSWLSGRESMRDVVFHRIMCIMIFRASRAS